MELWDVVRKLEAYRDSDQVDCDAQVVAYLNGKELPIKHMGCKLKDNVVLIGLQEEGHGEPEADTAP